MPAPCRPSSASDRSSRKSSGASCSGRVSKSPLVYRRSTRPARVRPARPARCVAEARLTLASSSRGSPVHGECEARRDSPLSTTAVTPSMVTDDSATLVLRITLRCDAGSTARACASIGKSPCSGRDEQPLALGGRRKRLARAADLASAGQEHQHVAARLLGQHLLHRARHLLFQRAIVGPRQMLDAQRVELALAPEQRTVAQEARHRIGFQRRAHHHQLQIRARARREPRQQRQRQIGLQVPLVELVEHHCAHALQRRIVEQAAHQHALGHVADARRAARHILEAHRVADAAPHLFAALGRHAPRRQPRRQPPRLRHQDLPRARQPRVEQRRRHARGLARPGRRFEHQRPRR